MENPHAIAISPRAKPTVALPIRPVLIGSGRIELGWGKVGGEGGIHPERLLWQGDEATLAFAVVNYFTMQWKSKLNQFCGLAML